MGALFPADPRVYQSALISALSLCLLLRANDVGVPVAAAAIAISSTFLLRWNCKHVFNPTNFALVAMLASGQAWVSPGQSGNAAILAFFFGCLGMLVVYRAARSDVTFAFFGAYALLLFGRSLWLGEPLTIPFHRLESGALLLFGFFMISDPRTTPDARACRVAFAALVAFGAWYVQFRLFRTNGLMWSLVTVSMVTPLLDRVFRGARYGWPAAAVPVAVTRDQVKVAEKSWIDNVDAYSAPRLVEYTDPDPCPPLVTYDEDRVAPSEAAEGAAPMRRSAATKSSMGVRVLDSYTVGEYDIQILSAEYSSGLEAWLRQNHYRIPDGAGAILQSYIRQNMRFFVAKVNLGEQRRLEPHFLRPLQVRYTSPKFMLPIRLGMVNADGAQDLLVYALTPRGRVETTNYRTTKIPTGQNVPEHVKSDFGTFYKALFARQVERNGMESVFLEYAWPLSVMCDPCSADPVPPDQLIALGADWVGSGGGKSSNAAYLTRLHVRYGLAHFPEDLVFQETPDTSTFQGRYVINHPFTGDTSCPAGRIYERTLAARQQEEVSNLATLTGWSAAEIRTRVPTRANPEAPPTPKDDGFWQWK